MKRTALLGKKNRAVIGFPARLEQDGETREKLSLWLFKWSKRCKTQIYIVNTQVMASHRAKDSSVRNNTSRFIKKCDHKTGTK